MLTVSPVLKMQLVLGEGIVWDSRSDAFWFVDIHGKEIFRYSVDTNDLSSWSIQQKIGWLIPEEGTEDWIGGLKDGFARLRFNHEVDIKWLARPFANSPHMRLNDAKADKHGNIWAGSMNDEDESRPDGVLFKLSSTSRLAVVDSGYCVCNGPAISPCSSLFLHTDSARRTIYAFDFDSASTTLTNKRIWHIFSEDEGYPDGMCFDSKGNLWVAHWGSGLVSCFNRNAVLLQRVRLPVSNVSNLAFGGKNLNRLFVTSARCGLSDTCLASEPLAGSVFELLNHDTQGILPNAFCQSHPMTT